MKRKLFCKSIPKGKKAIIHAKVKTLLIIDSSRVDVTFYRSIIMSCNLLAEAQSTCMMCVCMYAHRYVPMRLHLRNLHIKDLNNLFKQAIVSPPLASSTMYVIDTYTLSGLLQQRAVFTHKTVVTPCPIGYECI
jgi:hypothetical protein